MLKHDKLGPNVSWLELKNKQRHQLYNIPDDKV